MSKAGTGHAFRRFAWIRKAIGMMLPMSIFVFAISGCSSTESSLPALQASVVRATDLGIIPTNSDITARDGAYSGLFQGVSVWLYGDTFLTKPNGDSQTLISDSWSFTSDLQAQSGITGFQDGLDSGGSPAMILQETATEAAYNQAHNGNPCQTQPCGGRWALWPSSIVADSVNHRALIFYSVVNAQPGSFNFQAIGNSVALWQSLQTAPVRPVFSSPVVAGHPDMMFDENEPNFGSAALLDSGMLYIYGCGVPTNGADKGCRLARVDPAQVQNRSAWIYYAGNGVWSPQLSNAISVFDGFNILSVSWNHFLGYYVAIYSQPFSQNVMMRTSARPEGPWSGEAVAFTAMNPTSGNVYDAHAHSEYDANGGETIYVTYSRATGFLTSEVRLVALQLQPAN
jgi:Domain of unknown function (DUF4185)